MDNIDKKNLNFSKTNKIVENAVNTLEQGGIIVLPTDTVYGIAADATNKKSVKRLYDIKKRDKNKALNILVSSKEMARLCVRTLNDISEKLIDSFWPGALTLVVEKNEYISSIVTASKDTIGIRMPQNDITLAIIEKLGKPIACPSANISNRPSGTNISDIREDFLNDVDMYIDDGQAHIGIESTIVRVYDNYVKVLRQGYITVEDIIQKTGVSVLQDELVKNKTYNINVFSKFVSKQEDLNKLVENNITKNVAVLGFDDFIKSIKSRKVAKNISFFNLGSSIDCDFANKNIYKYLREIEKGKFDLCIIEDVKNLNLNSAIADILSKIRYKEI